MTVLALGGTVVTLVRDRRAQVRLLARFDRGADDQGVGRP